MTAFADRLPGSLRGAVVPRWLPAVLGALASLAGVFIGAIIGELQDAISAAIADPLITNVTVTLQAGYVSVSADHQRLNDASKTDTLSFRLDLSVNNGQLLASITDAQIDGKAIEQNRVDNWNQTISNRLSNFGNKRENATLQSISITPEIVTMTWNATR